MADGGPCCTQSCLYVAFMSLYPLPSRPPSLVSHMCLCTPKHRRIHDLMISGSCRHESGPAHASSRVVWAQQVSVPERAVLQTQIKNRSIRVQPFYL